MKDNYALIMAGGVGSRFWPLSTSQKPKQFIDILGFGKSLLQMTVERVSTIVPESNIFILTNKNYEELVSKQLPNIPQNSIVLEPERKNTAPCIAFASAKIHSLNENARLVVLPSDHLILNSSAFVDTIKMALDVASFNEMVTIGISPSRPETGYGYIEIPTESNHVDKNQFEVVQFREKPSFEIASQFLKSGNFLWNSGIFVWSSKTIFDAFRIHEPKLFNLFMKDLSQYNGPKEMQFASRVFSNCDDISIDYAILEKANNIKVIVADFDWSDLGTWNSLYQHLDKDSNGNYLNSENINVFDSKNNICILPENKQAIIDGLENYLIIDQNDKLLILKFENDQKIKEYLQKIKS